MILNYCDIETCIKKYANGNYVYFILDSAQVSEEALIFLNNVRSNVDVNVYSLFSGTPEGNVPFEVAPVLITIDNIDILLEKEFEAINKFWKEEQVLSIVFSSLILKDFMKKMKSYLTVIFPDESKKMFRWYDPRILKKLEHILEKEQEKEFFLDIYQWIFPIRDYKNIYLNKIKILESN